MELTIEQALQQGIAAHAKGKLYEAERLYRVILQSQPLHPDANHNLGVIAVSMNKADVALPLFKTALEANPKMELFWLSYINIFIKLKRFNAAVVVMNDSRKFDVSEEKLVVLETTLLNSTDIQEISPHEKGVFLEIWKKRNMDRGNVHLSINDAKLQKIPFTEHSAWLRPTFSDVARVSEYISNIYYRNSYLHKLLKKEKPTTLIDIGANIGLATLSLLNEFRFITKVIAIEAEEKNFSVLNANFKFWQTQRPEIEWIALNAVATHSDEEKLVRTLGLNDLKGGHSVSGTFRYASKKNTQKVEAEYEKVASITNLINDLAENEKIIVKLDIEGGEEHLFQSNTEWLKRCHFLTCEVHDAFHPVMINSSTNMIKALVENNFAFMPTNFTLCCYNRDYIIIDDKND